MPKENTKLCPCCQAMCDIGDTFCGTCGNSLTDHTANMPTRYANSTPSQPPVMTPILPDTLPANGSSSSSAHIYTPPPPPPTFYPAVPASSPLHSSQSYRPKKYLMIITVLVISLIGAGIIEMGQLHKGNPLAQITSNSTSTQKSMQPTALPMPRAGIVLYQEDGSDNWKGWSGSADWKTLNGTLLNDGTNDTSNATAPPTITAPYQVEGTSDYAVETRIRVQRQITTGAIEPGFNISARGASVGNTWEGYSASIYAPNTTNSQPEAYIQNNNQNFSASVLESANFDPGTNWHTYRFEVKGNDLRLLIDGALKLEVQDNQFLTGGQVGLTDYDEELTVASFKIIAL